MTLVRSMALELLAAKEHAQVLEAESKDDLVGALKARRAAEQQCADVQAARARAGIATPGEAEKAQADLGVAEANLAHALKKNDTVVRVKDGQLEITSPDGTVARCDTFRIDRGGKAPEEITVADGMVQFKTAGTTLYTAELRFPAAPARDYSDFADTCRSAGRPMIVFSRAFSASCSSAGISPNSSSVPA